jgi:hypothetical protein
MAYPKAKLKSSGDKASSSFRPIWIGKLSDKCLAVRNQKHLVYGFFVTSLWLQCSLGFLPATLCMKSPWEFVMVYPVSSLHHSWKSNSGRHTVSRVVLNVQP